MEAVIIFVSLFLVIFGICYLYYSTRNKERMALIEKGGDASIFMGIKRPPAPVWKIIILNLGLLLMGIGFGLLLSIFLTKYIFEGMYVNTSMTFACIFLMAGLGLFIGFFITKRLYREEQE